MNKFYVKSSVSFFVILFLLCINVSADKIEGKLSPAYGNIKIARITEKDFQPGMKRRELFEIFSETDLRTYRKYDNKESITFTYSPESPGFITFFLKDNKLEYWKINDREEAVRSYMGEFCSQYFTENAPVVYQAISKVLNKLPRKVFLQITDRKYPVIFTEQNNSGSGRFASSSEIIVLEQDPPTFTDGLCIIKLGTELSSAGNPEEVEGVIVHEIGHRYLNHGAMDHYSLKMEKETDDLAIKWGFEEELLRSRKQFGGKDNL